ncbi:hypothetical protein KZ813_06335 [Sphingomonas sp. RHCKR7]|uniref:hypothetical protein n=1 Tax=Sphingomonas folli TaxID=2862497 RepID=UPI001CA5A728|nr:hypothetical protein [Sphingomonas folli]MBW6526454.1 hypothetical protein [Sphingomonas folli]
MATVLDGQVTGSFSVSNVLARTTETVRAAPGLFFGVSFVLAALPSALFQLIAARAGGAGALLSAVSGVAWFVMYVAAQAILLRVAVTRLDDRPEPLGTLVPAALATMLPLVGVTIDYWIGVTLGVALLVVPGLIVATMWSVAMVAAVAEREGVFAALSRSRALTKGARWRVFGLFLLVAVLYSVAFAVVGVIRTTVFGQAFVQTEVTFAGVIFSALMSTLLLPLWLALQAALYVELRDWKDGPAADRLADIFA